MKLIAIGVLVFMPFMALGSTIVQTKQMALPTNGISELRVHCGAGSLYIVNAEWQNSIQVYADIEADHISPADLQGFVEKNAVLSLERKAFIDFLKEEKTQKRIEHMLKTGKPLRN